VRFWLQWGQGGLSGDPLRPLPRPGNTGRHGSPPVPKDITTKWGCNPPPAQLHHSHYLKRVTTNQLRHQGLLIFASKLLDFIFHPKGSSLPTPLVQNIHDNMGIAESLRSWLLKLLKPILEEHQALVQRLQQEVTALKQVTTSDTEHLKQRVEKLQEQNDHVQETLYRLGRAFTSLKADFQRIITTLEEQIQGLASKQEDQEALNLQLKAIEAELQKLSQELWMLNERWQQAQISDSASKPASERVHPHVQAQAKVKIPVQQPTSVEKEAQEAKPCLGPEIGKEQPETTEMSALSSEETKSETEKGKIENFPNRSSKTIEYTDQSENRPHQSVSSRSSSLLRRRIPPEKRGGRPRVGVKTKAEVEAGAEHGQEFAQGPVSTAKVKGEEDRTDSDVLSGRRQPGLICQKQGREWQVLREDEEGQTEPVEALGEEKLLFKLDASLKQGRQVYRVSRGWYLAIVPQDWKSLDPAIAPEPVAFPGYQAHYFDLTEEREIRFRIGDSEQIPWQRIEFRLVGEELRDDAQHLGPLFGEPPRVWAPISLWTEVSQIVIREERSGTDRWKTSFLPNYTQEEQTLPQELADRGGGRYTLLFYDREWGLLDSFDFRFLKGLYGIRVEPEEPAVLPGPKGHQPACITFQHEEDCCIEPLTEFLDSIEIRGEPMQTEVVLPPAPYLDQTCWQVLRGNASVDLEIRIPRIWWALAREETEPKASDWQAEVLSLSREDFAAVSDKALWLRLPCSVRRVRCGFPEDLRLFYAKSNSQGQLYVVVPLREFCGSLLLDRPGRTPLQVELNAQGKAYNVAYLEVRVGCCYCDFTCFEKKLLVKHFIQMHMAQLYREPTYEEMRKLIPELPPAIYKCGYCNEYVEADNPDHPTSTINAHIERNHHPRLRGEKPRFSIVSSPEEIRSNISKYGDLPRFYICKLCNKSFDLRKGGEEKLHEHVHEHWTSIAKVWTS